MKELQLCVGYPSLCATRYLRLATAGRARHRPSWANRGTLNQINLHELHLWRTVTLVLLCLVVCVLPLRAASLIGLGSFLESSYPFSEAWGISPDGQVVVGVSGSPKSAFRWSLAAGMTNLGDPPAGNYRGADAASAASWNGSVVVGTLDDTSYGEACRWQADQGLTALGDLPGYVDESGALGVSSNGNIIVGYGRTALGLEACRWTKDGGLLGLGDLPGGRYESTARGISANGSVIAGYGYSSNGYEAFRWTQVNGMVGIGDLPGGIFDSSASAISADGLVIVGASQSSNGFEAFRWSQAGGMVGLGDLPGGAFYSIAHGVSSNGTVVVGSAYTGLGREAFCWTPSRGMERLWDLIVAQGIDPTADGWAVLTRAYGVSADGRRVVGYGTRNARTEAFYFDFDGSTPLPRLGPATLEFGTLQLPLRGLPGRALEVEVSDDLRNWRFLESIPLDRAGAATFWDSTPNLERNFYRAKMVP